MKPNFFIIGAPKCGTTSLATYLGMHPNVFMCSPKEPHYFSTDINWQLVKNKNDYLKLFAKATNDNFAIGEGSVFYLFSQNAVPNILKFNPDAKFIVMLRNPLELIVSLHAENQKSGSETLVNFEDAWRAQSIRKINSLLRNPNAHQYEAVAKTGNQLARLYDLVPPDNVCIILYDDFVIDPRACYLNVLEFLSIEDDHRKNFGIYNERLEYRSIFLNKIIVSVSDFIGLASRYHIPLKTFSDILRKFNSTSKQQVVFSDDFRQELITVFQEDILLLERLLKRDLSIWLH